MKFEVTPWAFKSAKLQNPCADTSTGVPPSGHCILHPTKTHHCSQGSPPKPHTLLTKKPIVTKSCPKLVSAGVQRGRCKTWASWGCISQEKRGPSLQGSRISKYQALKKKKKNRNNGEKPQTTQNSCWEVVFPLDAAYRNCLKGTLVDAKSPTARTANLRVPAPPSCQGIQRQAPKTALREC